MTDIMISYSRRDGEFVKRLHDSLAEQGRDIWVDWEDIPLTADWWAEIAEAIEKAATIIIVLSPDSVGSPICQMEVDHALQHNKRLIPIVRRETSLEEALAGVEERGLDDNSRKALNGRDILEITRENWNAIARHNWIFFKNDQVYDHEFERLTAAIDTDLEHSREHTRLLVRALEWQNKENNPSFLLEGIEIEEAEHWLTAGMSKEPQPTALHAEYINLSRERATAQQRKIMTGISVALVVSLVLMVISIVLFFQAESDRKLANQSASTAIAAEATAQENADRALALVLSTSAQLELDDFNTDLAIALGLEAQGIEALSQVQRTLAQSAYAPGTFQVIDAHDGIVNAVATTPDGRSAISAGADGTLKLWDLISGELLHEFSGHEGAVNAIAVNGDGTRFISASTDGTLRLWDIESGEPLLTMAGAPGVPVNAVAYAPDGTFALSGGDDRVISMWNLEDGELIATFEAEETLAGDVQALAINRSGTQALSGGERSEFIVWDIETRAEFERLSDDGTDIVTSVAFSPGGAMALAGGTAADNSLFLWDIEEGDPIRRFSGHGDIVYAVAYAPDGETIISGSQDGSMRLWNVDNGQELWRFTGHQGGLRGVAYLPDSLTAISSSYDGTLRHWSLTDGAQLTMYEAHSAAVYDTDISPDGQYILSGSRDGFMRLWDRESGESLHQFQPRHGDAVWVSTFSPDGTRLLSGVRNGSARLWDMETREIICEMVIDPNGLLNSNNRIWDATFSPDSNALLTVAANGSVRLWDANDCAPIRGYEGHEGHVRAVAFHPDGQSFVTGGEDMTLIHWSTEGGELGRFAGHQDWLWTIAFSSDGQMLASGSSDGVIILWDAATYRPIHLIAETGGSTTGVTFSPDGKLLASASGDGIVRLWDVASGSELRRFHRHQGGVWAVDFAPNGQTVVSASGDNSLILWRANVGLQDLIEWTYANRYIRDLTCEERKTFNAPSAACEAEAAATSTPEPDGGELIAATK